MGLRLPPLPGSAFREPTEFLDSSTPAVREFARRVVKGAADPVQQAVRLYYAVRDGIRYDPYRISLRREPYRASNVLAVGAAFCLPKANLLAAAARAVGIPSAIGLADVVNHLCTPKLREAMGGREVFINHGYALLFLEGKWVKAAPAFNIELCRRFGVRPTDFNGKEDAILQEFDSRGRRHMEYLKEHGCWDDFPYERVVRDFQAYYPPELFFENGAAASRGDLDEPFQPRA